MSMYNPRKQEAKDPMISTPKPLLYRDTDSTPAVKAHATYHVNGSLYRENFGDGVKQQPRKQHHSVSQARNSHLNTPSMLLSSNLSHIQDPSLHCHSCLQLKQTTKKKQRMKDSTSTMLMGATYTSFAHSSEGMVSIPPASAHGHYSVFPVNTAKRTQDHHQTSMEFPSQKGKGGGRGKDTSPITMDIYADASRKVGNAMIQSQKLQTAKQLQTQKKNMVATDVRPTSTSKKGSNRAPKRSPYTIAHDGIKQNEVAPVAYQNSSHFNLIQEIDAGNSRDIFECLQGKSPDLHPSALLDSPLLSSEPAPNTPCILAPLSETQKSSRTPASTSVQPLAGAQWFLSPLLASKDSPSTGWNGTPLLNSNTSPTVSPMLSACDTVAGAQKRKMSSPFLSFSPSSQPITSLPVNNKRFAPSKASASSSSISSWQPTGRLSVLSSGNDNMAKNGERHSSFSFQDGINFGHGQDGNEGLLEASPALSAQSCGSMSSYSLGLQPSGHITREEGQTSGLIDQTVAVLKEYQNSPEMRMVGSSQILPLPSPLISPLIGPMMAPKMTEA